MVLSIAQQVPKGGKNNPTNEASGLRLQIGGSDGTRISDLLRDRQAF